MPFDLGFSNCQITRLQNYKLLVRVFQTMTNNSKIWVSELNARPEVRGAFPDNAIRLYDTTLRDGVLTVGVVLSPQQKLEIAHKLDELGVSRIEADVEELVRLNLRYSLIEAPVSEIKLKAYGISREEVLRRIRDAVSAASDAGITVAFFAVDGTRTELEFLKTVYLSALDAGAKELVVVDTIGACGPEAAEYLTRQVCQWAGKGVPVHFHGHNDFGMATACAVAAVRGGATWIQGTINGMGERAGNGDIAEIALALRCLYDVPVVLNLEKVREVSEVVRRAAGYTLDGWKPLVGQNLFMRESGAVATQFHLPEAIEPYSSEIVHAKRRIVLGKKSGLDNIDLKCKELGVTITAEQRGPVLAAVKEAAVKQAAISKCGLVSDDQFRRILAAMRIV